MIVKALQISVAALALAGSAAAQNTFGQQPGFGQPQPGFQQPQPGFQQPQPGFGQQPGFQQPQPGFQQPGQPQQPDPNQQMQALMQMLQQMAQMERQDYGIPPQNTLHDGAMHGPTPTSLPGARLVTTAEVVQLVQSGQPYLIFDVLGGGQTLPGAIPAVGAAQPGSFQDQTQQGFGQFLQQATQGRPDVPMVFYCLSTQCWMSYNAALRAVNLGYRNVLWYRGGIEAWSYAGLPMMQAGGGMPPGGGGQMPPGGGGGMPPGGMPPGGGGMPPGGMPPGGMPGGGGMMPPGGMPGGGMPGGGMPGGGGWMPGGGGGMPPQGG